MFFAFSSLCAHSSTEFDIPNGEIEASQNAQGMFCYCFVNCVKSLKHHPRRILKRTQHAADCRNVFFFGQKWDLDRVQGVIRHRSSEATTGSLFRMCFVRGDWDAEIHLEVGENGNLHWKQVLAAAASGGAWASLHAKDVSRGPSKRIVPEMQNGFTTGITTRNPHELV